MGKKYTVEPVAFGRQHLLPEIGAAINYIRIIVPMHPDRYPQTLIPGIAAMAYRVAAAYYRYALGGSGA